MYASICDIVLAVQDRDLRIWFFSLTNLYIFHVKISWYFNELLSIVGMIQTQPTYNSSMGCYVWMHVEI